MYTHISLSLNIYMRVCVCICAYFKHHFLFIFSTKMHILGLQNYIQNAQNIYLYTRAYIYICMRILCMNFKNACVYKIINI